MRPAAAPAAPARRTRRLADPAPIPTGAADSRRAGTRPASHCRYRRHRQSGRQREGSGMVFIVLWLLGVPLGLIVLLWLLGVIG